MIHRQKLDVMTRIIEDFAGIDLEPFIDTDGDGRFLDLDSRAFRMAVIREADRRARESTKGEEVESAEGAEG